MSGYFSGIIVDYTSYKWDHGVMLVLRTGIFDHKCTHSPSWLGKIMRYVVEIWEMDLGEL